MQPGYHRNQQYSIVALTNAAGTLVERYTYTAYGTLSFHAADGTVRSSRSYNDRYTYTGREYDPDLGLYHFRARWYQNHMFWYMVTFYPPRHRCFNKCNSDIFAHASLELHDDKNSSNKKPIFNPHKIPGWGPRLR